jgi:chemosensory pili system protein ChpA (sensor histidine kinase/response regulator)
VSNGLEDDPEMREVFLEEAAEVLQGAREALAQLAAAHDDAAAMTTVRRAFHTLKGSSRMVGLMAFGEAAWSCEQLYNARIADQVGANAAVQSFSGQALDYFERWVEGLAAGDAGAFGPDEIARQADNLRLSGAPQAEEVDSAELPAELMGINELPDADLPAFVSTELPDPSEDEPEALTFDLPLDAAESSSNELQRKVPGLPLASDLDLDLPALTDDLLTAKPVADSPVGALPEVDLPALDLAALDDDGALAITVESPESDLEEITADDVAELQILDDLVEPVAQPSGAAVHDEPVAGTAASPIASSPGDAPSPSVVADGATTAPAELATANDAEAYRQIGPLRISIPLFNIYLNEADELSRRLGVELAEWSLEQQRPVGDTAVALAHSLAGNSGTVGYAGLSQLARELEHALGRAQSRGHGVDGEAALFIEASDEIRRLLHLFAAGFLNEPAPHLLQRLHDLAHAAPEVIVDEVDGAAPEMAALGRAALLPFTALADTAPRAQAAEAMDLRGNLGDDIDQVDAVDAELFPIFEEEALELLPQLQSRLRDWSHRPGDPSASSACMRCLHTLKGSARLAGAMRLGEMAHRLETLVQGLAAQGGAARVQDVDALVVHADSLEMAFMGLQQPAAGEADSKAEAAKAKAKAQAVLQPTATPAKSSAEKPALPVLADVAVPATPVAAATFAARPAIKPSTDAAPVTQALVDWKRFAPAASDDAQQASTAVGASAGSVRVRTNLLDRLVNHAGEVSISRSRIESDVGQLKGGMGDLSDNLERLRSQLRDIELQAETQIGTRMEAARAAALQFDPLEMDRFTRFQELTRMMAESVADVATWQRGLQRTLQSAEDALAHQARMTRDMQDDLLRTRMVEFEGLSERLYRVVRQAAKETGKSVRLDIVGGSIEVDRGVLDRMTPAFEHLLRNSVVHGIETPSLREAAGKDGTGTVTVAVTQVGNEVGVEVRDDGAGLDLARIRDRARSMGLVQADAEPTEAELANLIFQPGVTTATSVTDLAGRGVGMDVVRTDVNAMGGRIETASAPGQGTSFRLLLPLTTAVTQVVMLRCGERAFAVPATLVEIVRRVPLNDLARAYDTGTFGEGAQAMPFFWLDALLDGSARGLATGRTAPVVVIRSAAQRVVLHIDEVLGNQEVVVKNLGPQLSRVPGLVGMTLLPSGLPALIYNPVALATLYGEQARAATRAALALAQGRGTERIEAESSPVAPLVLVVDDSLTVRRVTQRLLEREGYRVSVAKDGLDGLEKLSLERPAVLLTDIEMPRMDGFDLVRNLRADERLAHLPVIMITSRIAQKHRDYAADLGVDHYLGKPYAEDELLSLVARYARRAVPA